MKNSIIEVKPKHFKFLLFILLLSILSSSSLPAQDSSSFENFHLKASGVYGTFYINPTLVIKQKAKWKFLAGISYAKLYIPIGNYNINSSTYSFGLTGNLYRFSNFNRFSLEYGPELNLTNSNTKFIVDSVQSRNFNRLYVTVLLDVLLKYKIRKNLGIFLGYSYGASYRLNELRYQSKNSRSFEGRGLYQVDRLYIGCSFKF